MKVLISSRSFGKVGSIALDMLRKAGLTPILNPYNKTPNEEEIIRLIDEDTVGIIAGTEKITKKVLKAGSSIKVVSRYGIGIDNIDLEAAKSLNIAVKNTPEAPTQAVAELTIGLILNLLRKIALIDRRIRANEWEPPVGNLLSGKTVGIIGLGRIGKTVIKLLEPFGVNILVQEIRPDSKFVAQHQIQVVSLKQVLAESDIVSLHIPLSPGTKNLIGKDELDLMKPSALLINTARGGLIDEEALAGALARKSLGGAALDAFSNEPYKGKLKEFDNVVLTAHIGSLTEETRKRMELETVENLINSLKREN